LKCTKIIARNVMNQARCCAAQRVVLSLFDVVQVAAV
jgi:hypothetical protein